MTNTITSVPSVSTNIVDITPYLAFKRFLERPRALKRVFGTAQIIYIEKYMTNKK